jgi:hypothetical protein
MCYVWLANMTFHAVTGLDRLGPWLVCNNASCPPAQPRADAGERSFRDAGPNQ